MLKKIMVPLDGSAFAEAALRTGIGLARRDQAELSLLTVVPPPVPPVYLEGAVGVATELHERAASVAAEYVRSVTERVRGEAPGLEIHGLTVLGGVVDSIDHAAREGATDLIVMSSHGRGPFQRMWLGSVADGVLRHGPAPVLLVRPAGDSAADSGGPVEFPTVLIPIDASPAARGIIPDAVDVAGAAARYRVVRVSVPRSGPRPGHLPDSRDEVPDPEADRIRAEELLDQAV